MAVRLHYFRGMGQMSLHRKRFFANGRMALAAAGLLAGLPLAAQYSAKTAKSTPEAPEMRAIAVLEWNGDPDHPKASRLVPVTLLDGGVLQDGSIYLARPVPLALAGNVEYEIQRNGQPTGVFDVSSAGQEMGGWVGHGVAKPLPVTRPKAETKTPRPIEDENSDRPVLHRKHPADDSSNSQDSNGAGSKPPAGSPVPQADSDADPDRPKLHRNDSGDSSASSPDSASSAGAPSDPDRPVLRKKSADDSTDRAGAANGSSASSTDSDRPVLKKNKKKPDEEGSVSAYDSADPDRPRLKRGKPSDEGSQVAPTLLGLPAEMEQAVAVSDAKSRPEHPWSFTWADPVDEAKMKAALEDLARDALGLNPPPPPAPAPQPKRIGSRKSLKPAEPEEPPPPAPLLDEQFRVFELAYGSGATLVLSAHSDAPPGQQKFATLVAQPDLYGNLLVLLKSVGDASHLDETPRLRLIDAVDALADNRGELLFELRGATQRQFVLYRILRGRAEKLFAGTEAFYGAPNSE